MADAARLALALLLPTATVFATVAARPRAGTGVVAPIRLAIVRGAVAVGAGAVAGVEVLSTVDHDDPAGVLALWVSLTVAAGVAAAVRRPDLRAFGRRLTARWRGLPWLDRVLLGGLAGLALAELVLAVASAPNNYDSNYYHLSKVEHWVADRDVRVYPTLQLQQVGFAPAGEYLLLHLRLLTGGDRLYNLVQWTAGLGAALAVSRIAAQLGAGRRAQLLAAAVLLTAPMTALQATSTQTDLILAAWVACAGTLALQGLRGRARGPDVLALGAAAGLCAATKATGLPGLAVVLLFWGVTQLRLGRRAFPRTAVAGVAIVLVALVLYGPFMLRMQRTFGSPLGPPDSSRQLAMQRHDPAALLVNALRIGSSTVVVPIPAVNSAVADGVVAVARAIHVDPQDPRITLTSGVYPNPRWWPDEDHAPMPIQSVLLFGALAAALLLRRIAGVLRGYAGMVLMGMLLTVAVVKWQVWGNRLLLSMLALGAPVAGWWLERLLDRFRVRRRAVAGAIAVMLAVSFAGAYASVFVGTPRRLVGNGSVFTQTALEQRFARQPDRLEAYRRAAAMIDAGGARTVGVLIGGDQWEYPFWVLLPGRRFVWLASFVPGRPAAQTADVGAVLCVTAPEYCHLVVPPTWRYVQLDGLVAVGLPPTR
jgi:hypothetical protein